jgi:hypothetical protein
MAYSNSTSDRMDELRFRSQQSPRNDASLLGLVSPPRNGTRVQQPLQQDGRNGLMRRFTTDSGRVPTIGSLNSQRGGQDSQEYGPSVGSPWRYCLNFPLSLDDNPTDLSLSSRRRIIVGSVQYLWLLLTCNLSQTFHKVQLVSNLPL